MFLSGPLLDLGRADLILIGFDWVGLLETRIGPDRAWADLGKTKARSSLSRTRFSALKSRLVEINKTNLNLKYQENFNEWVQSILYLFINRTKMLFSMPFIVNDKRKKKKMNGMINVNLIAFLNKHFFNLQNIVT